MEVIGTPDFNYLDGWVNTFGNIVYVYVLIYNKKNPGYVHRHCHFSSILYIRMCILQYIKNAYSSLYSSSLLLQQWKDDSVDSVALMCQGVSITDSSHMYSLIVMYPQLPYSCSKVQMRETRQAIWEELWHKSSSNNWLAVWMPLRISVRVFLSVAFLVFLSFSVI